MTDFEGLLRLLTTAGIEFILIGGTAARAHGSARSTNDIDVVYRRASENIGHLAAALAPYSPYLRGAPPGLPFRWDARTIENGLNFTLTTSLGDLDLLGEVIGGGRFEELLEHTIEIDALGLRIRCVDLSTLIVLKRAAGRPKDLEVIAELEAILEEQQRG